jgi:hypothetical protein
MAAGTAEAIVMLMTARRHAEFKLAGRIVPPTLFAVAGALAGWIVAIQVGATVIGGLAGGLCAAAVYLAASWLWHRRYLLDSAQLSLRGLREATKSTPAN